MENLGKAIYEHYDKYLGESIGADSYQEYDVQLLGYQDAVHGSLTFATMGMSLHEKTLGQCCEVVLTTEKDLDACADIFTSVLFYLLDAGLPISRGTSIGGIDGLNPTFSRNHHKTAVYFTEPTMFPKTFRKVTEKCRIYMALFISPEEEAYLQKNGTEAFEKLLEESKGDIIDLDRPSAAAAGVPAMLS